MRIARLMQITKPNLMSSRITPKKEPSQRSPSSLDFFNIPGKSLTWNNTPLRATTITDDKMHWNFLMKISLCWKIISHFQWNISCTLGRSCSTLPALVSKAIRMTADIKPVNWVVPPAVACVIDLDIDADAGMHWKNAPNELHMPCKTCSQLINR